MKLKFKEINKIINNNFVVSNFNGNDFLYFHYDAKNNDDIRYIQDATLRKE